MIKKLIVSMVALCALSSGLKAENFTFCPKGFYTTDSGEIVFQPKKWTPDYELKLPDEGFIQFSGPIFPKYKVAWKGTKKVDAEKKEISATQDCKFNGAVVTKDFKLVNGGILSKISYDGKGKEFDRVGYRIILPIKTFAGKACLYGEGKKLDLPKEKAQYVLLRSNKNDELRFQISENLEVGLKFISGIKSYAIADCRHHGTSEPIFHIYVDMEGNALEYFLCVLKPGEPFPATTEQTESKPAEKTEEKPAETAAPTDK